MTQDTITEYSADGAIPVASGVARLTKTSPGAFSIISPGAFSDSLQLHIVSVSDYEQVVTGVFLDGGTYTELHFGRGGVVCLRSDGNDWIIVSMNRCVTVGGTGDNAVDLSPSLPTVPTIGVATAGDGEASVAYTLGNNGGSPILSVVATFTPTVGDPVVSDPSLDNPITVAGLDNSVQGTLTVHANNIIGPSVESAASNAVTPVAGVATTWDVANKGANITLSGGNLVATTTLFPTAVEAVAATVAHNTLKRVIRFVMNYTNAAGDGECSGAVVPTPYDAVADPFGAFTAGLVVTNYGSIFADGVEVATETIPVVSGHAGFITIDQVGGKGWADNENNVYAVDIAAGTNPHWIFTPATSVIPVGIGATTAAASTTSITIDPTASTASAVMWNT